MRVVAAPGKTAFSELSGSQTMAAIIEFHIPHTLMTAPTPRDRLAQPAARPYVTAHAYPLVVRYYCGRQTTIITGVEVFSETHNG